MMLHFVAPKAPLLSGEVADEGQVLTYFLCF